MDFLNKLERKFGKYSISNFMVYIMIGQAIVAASTALTGSTYLNQYICFSPPAIIRGQIWRLLTFVFVPDVTSFFWFIISALLYCSIGRSLEQVWGVFKFNVYYILGALLNILGLFIFPIIIGANPFDSAITNYYTNMAPYVTLYLNLSLFLAYAALFPNQTFLVYFILPVKAKYLAFLDLILYGIIFIQSSLPYRILLIVTLLNCCLFFGTQLFDSFRRTSTQKKFKKSMQQRQGELKQGPPIRVAFHKCTVCGKTELTDPDMEFRYCSKCNGAHEYCMDHLHNHEHIQ